MARKRSDDATATLVVTPDVKRLLADAFESTGGRERFMLWASRTPEHFYPLLVRAFVPEQVNVSLRIIKP